MIAILYLAAYIFCGVAIVRFLLPRQSVLTRAWLGASCGLLLMMWLPALMAFAVKFSIAGHLLALIPLAGLPLLALALLALRHLRKLEHTPMPIQTEEL